MQPGEYIVIKVADIEEEIKAHKSKISHVKREDGTSSAIDGNHFGAIEALQNIRTNPTDLYGVVEDAYQQGNIDYAESFDDSDSLNIKKKALLEHKYLNNLEI